MAHNGGRASRVLGLVLPLLEQGGPVFSLLLLLVGTLVIHFLLGELRAQQSVTRELVERLLACTELLGRTQPPPP